MPLPPGGNQAWPPAEFERPSREMLIHGTWYAGDPEDLANLYDGEMIGGDRPNRGPANRPAQFRGGLVGTVARWFWGQPIPEGELRAKLHVPIASDIARTSANLLFAESPRIEIGVPKPDPVKQAVDEAKAKAAARPPMPPVPPPAPGTEPVGDAEQETSTGQEPAADPAQPPVAPPPPPVVPDLPSPEDLAVQEAHDRLDDLVDEGELHSVLLEAAEIQVPLKGVYLVVTWDDQITDKPWIPAVHSDCAVPEFKYSRLWAVTLWRIVKVEGQKVWRHLERHERGATADKPGLILDGLYEGTPEVLGEKRSLTDQPATAELQDQVEGVPGALTVEYLRTCGRCATPSTAGRSGRRSAGRTSPRACCR